MKHYQDHDPLHGNGKAMPKPKRPTNYSYRGGRMHGIPVTLDRQAFRAERAKTVKVTMGRPLQMFSVFSSMLACLGIRPRRGNRGR